MDDSLAFADRGLPTRALVPSVTSNARTWIDSQIQLRMRQIGKALGEELCTVGLLEIFEVFPEQCKQCWHERDQQLRQAGPVQIQP